MDSHRHVPKNQVIIIDGLIEILWVIGTLCIIHFGSVLWDRQTARRERLSTFLLTEADVGRTKADDKLHARSAVEKGKNEKYTEHDQP